MQMHIYKTRIKNKKCFTDILNNTLMIHNLCISITNIPLIYCNTKNTVFLGMFNYEYNMKHNSLSYLIKLYTFFLNNTKFNFLPLFLSLRKFAYVTLHQNKADILKQLGKNLRKILLKISYSKKKTTFNFSLNLYKFYKYFFYRETI